MAYRVFTRTWWRKNAAHPDGLEPSAGRRTYLNTPAVESEAEAQRICRQDFESRYGAGEAGRDHYRKTRKSNLGLRAEYEDA